MECNEDLRRLNKDDVYDLAADLREEFAKWINVYGTDGISQIIPKVVQVLEHLEQMAVILQAENEQLEDLRLSVERLTTEKGIKSAEKEKYRKVFFTIFEKCASICS